MDFSVISFGVTAYEFAALYIPSIYLCLSTDHEKSSYLFELEGIGKTMGEYSNIDKKEIIQTISYFLSNSRKLCDMSDKANLIKISDLNKISRNIVEQTEYA